MKRWNSLAKYTTELEQGLLDYLLENRGFHTQEEKDSFLKPASINQHLKDLPTDFKVALKKTRDLILDTIAKEIPIVIHGDYDADGVCATALLFNTLRYELSYKKTYSFIPNRFDHGYGLSKASIDSVLAMLESTMPGSIKNALIITVDSGITAVEEVSYAKSLGLDVIITDHHQKPAKLPKADCILWSDQVVGSTIAWILSKALGSKDTQSLSLAAIATVTDLQPLVSFNRSIVKSGLRLLNTNPPISIKKLLDSTGKKISEVTTYELGWVIGPRLNASGRLAEAADSLDLLTSRIADVSLDSLVDNLNKINFKRQEKTLEMYDLVSDFDNKAPPKIIISHNENYHEGIIGLVASKLVQKHYRPAIVISLEEDLGKGSVRSVPGINIIEILRKFEDLFINVGGHPMAAGFSIDKANIADLQVSLDNYFNEYIADDLLVPTLKIDLEIPLSLVDMQFLDQLSKLKPFGMGNKEPTFLTRNVSVVRRNWVGSNKNHLSLTLSNGERMHKGIFFNGIEHAVAKSLELGDKIDVVYKISKNEFRGNVTADLMIVDMRLAEDQSLSEDD